MSFTMLRRSAVVFSLLVPMASCTLDNLEAPPLSGPSGFSLGIVMTASPDQLPRDGASESRITLQARDANGDPERRQLRLTLLLPVNAPAGARLSASEVTTDANGAASFTLFAPNPGSVGDITVTATPVGDNSGPPNTGNAANAVPRTILVSATPRNTTAPAPAISFTPSSPELNQSVSFTGTATDEGVACSTLCTFAWSFGDGDTASGATTSHTFKNPGLFTVRLTVTDGAGTTSTTTQAVTVAAIALPTVSFSPTTATTNQPRIFTATATASTNHRIVRYAWSWGDGGSDESVNPSISHTFTAGGAYTVTVTVTDDLGQTMSATQTVTVTP